MVALGDPVCVVPAVFHLIWPHQVAANLHTTPPNGSPRKPASDFANFLGLPQRSKQNVTDIEVRSKGSRRCFSARVNWVYGIPALLSGGNSFCTRSSDARPGRIVICVASDFWACQIALSSNSSGNIDARFRQNFRLVEDLWVGERIRVPACRL